jgi:hypothetical protein
VRAAFDESCLRQSIATDFAARHLRSENIFTEEVIRPATNADRGGLFTDGVREEWRAPDRNGRETTERFNTATGS